MKVLNAALSALVASTLIAAPVAAQAAPAADRTGASVKGENIAGLGWGERSPCCFRGTDRFFRPGYAVNLVASWIPSDSNEKPKSP